MNRLPVEGESFGRYRLLRKLGQGGMGVVYAARDTTLDREVALKLVVPHLAGDEGFRARFQHEAEVLARLESPRIVRIYDHGEHDETLFLVTQLVAGGDLHKLIGREGALPPALASSVLTQVVEGLCDAHAVGVTHRDIKPANVLLRERGRELEAFLCDFGIATTPGAELSRTGTIAGSLPYMAPERHRGEDAGAQGDVYAAGCLLWHGLTGSAPYAGTDVEIAMAHLQAPLPQLPGRDPFSRKANEVIARAMAKDRRRRHPTARALLTDLQALAPLAPDSISLPGATAIRQALPPERPRRWRAGLAAVLAVVAVFATAAVARSAMSDGTPSAEPQDPVTRTVSQPSGPELADRRTLRPRAVVTTRAGELVTVVPPGPAPGVPAGTATVRTTAPSRRPGAAPRPRFRCWDDTIESSLAACGSPSGRAGLRHVFLDGSSLSCSSESVTGDRVAVLDCPYGGSGHLRLAQYTSVDAAYSFYNRWYDRTGGRWVHDGADWGWMWFGSTSNGYRSTRLHRAGPYVVTAMAADSDGAAAGFGKVRWRSPSTFRGVRLPGVSQ